MDSLGQSDYKSDYKDGTILTPTNMSFDYSTLEYTHMIRSPIEVLSKQVEEVREEDFKQKSRIVQLEKKLGEKESEYQKELKKLKDQEQERAREIYNLTTAKANLQSECSSLKNELNKCESERASAYKDYEKLKREDDKRSREIESLSKKNRELDKQVKENNKSYNELYDRNKLLHDELKKKHSELIRCEETYKQLEIEKQEESDKYRYNLDQLNDKLKDRSNEVEELSSTLKELEDRNQKLQHEKSYADSLAKSQRNEIVELKRGKEELEERLKESSKYIKEINDLNAKVRQLSQSNKLLKDANAKNERKINELKIELEDGGETIESLKDQLSQREEYHKENENKLKTDLNLYLNQLQEANSKNDALKSSLDQLNELIDDVNDRSNADKDQLEKLQQEMYLLKDELNEKRSNLNRLREEFDQQKVKLSKLNEEKQLLSTRVKDAHSLAIRYNELFKEHFKLNPEKCQTWCFDSRFTSAKMFSADFIESKFDELTNECEKRIQIEANKLKQLTDEYEEKLLEKENLIKELNEDKLNLGTEKDSSDWEKSRLEKKVDRLVEENYDLIQKVNERGDEILVLTSENNKLKEEKRQLDGELAELQRQRSSIQRETSDLDSRVKSQKEADKNSISLSNRTKSIEKSGRKLHYPLDQNSNYLKSIDEKPKFSGLGADENKNSLNLNQNKYHRSLSSTKNDLAEQKQLLECQQKAENLLKALNKKSSESKEKPEVCFDLKDTEDSSLESSNFKNSNRLEKYNSFKEHLNFNDQERRTKKGLPSATSLGDKQSTIRELDEQPNSDLPTGSGAANRPKVQLTDFYKKPTNKFTSTKDVHFTSTPINKNTRIRKLNYDY